MSSDVRIWAVRKSAVIVRGPAVRGLRSVVDSVPSSASRIAAACARAAGLVASARGKAGEKLTPRSCVSRKQTWRTRRSHDVVTDPTL